MRILEDITKFIFVEDNVNDIKEVAVIFIAPLNDDEYKIVSEVILSYIHL